MTTVIPTTTTRRRGRRSRATTGSTWQPGPFASLIRWLLGGICSVVLVVLLVVLVVGAFGAGVAFGIGALLFAAFVIWWMCR